MGALAGGQRLCYKRDMLETSSVSDIDGIVGDRKRINSLKMVVGMEVQIDCEPRLLPGPALIYIHI
jgi:hypothetical protein